MVPGDTIVFKCDMIGDIRRGITTMFAQAFVGDSVVSEGELTAQIVKNKA